MKQFSLLLIALFIGTILYAQKVAAYSYGELGNDNYERFSFWIKNNKRSDIYYSYSKVGKEIKLKFIGTGIFNGDSCFKVQFANDYVLHIIPKNNQLKVCDPTGKYSKYFKWEYEGPINGIGTFCEPCAEDGDAAMDLIKIYYQK